MTLVRIRSGAIRALSFAAYMIPSVWLSLLLVQAGMPALMMAPTIIVVRMGLGSLVKRFRTRRQSQSPIV